MKTKFLRSLFACGAAMLLSPVAMAQQGVMECFLDDSAIATPASAADFGVDAVVYTDGDVTEITPPPHDGPSSGDREDVDSRGAECNSCHCSGCGDGCAGDVSCGECPSGCCGFDGCASDCLGFDGGCGDCANYDMNAGMYYVEIQNMFMRTHLSSEAVGKLREKYEWSPRVVMGYEAPSGLGGRVRWWNYSRTNSTLDTSNNFHFDLDVLDIEGTGRFSSRRADLVIAGGLRYANFEISEDDDEIAADLPGITFAADGRLAICCKGISQWSAVCGARWSLLGGDWEGDANALIDDVFDDNVTTQEIYGGFEYLCHRCNYDLYARIVFEVQNWRSDVLGENSATDSIGFIGPAIHGGVSF